MRTTLGTLRDVIQRTIAEAYRLRVVDTTPFDPGDRDQMKGSIDAGRARKVHDTEVEIEELQRMPEFADLDTFMAAKLDDDQTSYDWKELQALARNVTSRRLGHDAVADPRDVAAVKRVLSTEMGFTFVPREAERDIRGARSNAHGTHPFAGSDGGGSGFSSDFGGGGGFTSFGGGPGAMGSGAPWKAGDKKNLPMGSRRGRG